MKIASLNSPALQSHPTNQDFWYLAQEGIHYKYKELWDYTIHFGVHTGFCGLDNVSLDCVICGVNIGLSVTYRIGPK